jgi:hypothetical protein
MTGKEIIKRFAIYQEFELQLRKLLEPGPPTLDTARLIAYHLVIATCKEWRLAVDLLDTVLVRQGRAEDLAERLHREQLRRAVEGGGLCR